MPPPHHLAPCPAPPLLVSHRSDLGTVHPELGSIHSSAKPALGARIARAALAAVYKVAGVVWEGPRPLAARADRGCTERAGSASGGDGGPGPGVEAENCVVVSFSTLAGSGGLVLEAGVDCPSDPATGTPVLLPLYCNGSEIGSGAAGFEVKVFGPPAVAGLPGGGPSEWRPARRVQLSSSLPGSIVVSAGVGCGLPTRVRYAFADWPVVSVRNGPAGHRIPARIFDIDVVPPST